MANCFRREINVIVNQNRVWTGLVVCPRDAGIKVSLKPFYQNLFAGREQCFAAVLAEALIAHNSGKIRNRRPTCISRTDIHRFQAVAVASRGAGDSVMRVAVCFFQAVEQILAFCRAPPVAIKHLNSRWKILGNALLRWRGLILGRVLDQQGHGGSLADAFLVVGRGKSAGVGQPVGRGFAGFAAVAVEVVNPDTVEIIRQMLAHDDERRFAHIRRIADVANHAAPAALGDAPLGEPEKAHIQVIEVELLDAPLFNQPLLVRRDQVLLFAQRHAAKGVIRRVAQNHDDFLRLLDLIGRVALLLEFGEGQHRVFRLFGRLPAGQRVGQVDACALVVLQRRAELAQQQADLQMRHHVGRGQQLKAEQARGGGLLQLVRGQRVGALAFEFVGHHAQHFD